MAFAYAKFNFERESRFFIQLEAATCGICEQHTDKPVILFMATPRHVECVQKECESAYSMIGNGITSYFNAMPPKGKAQAVSVVARERAREESRDFESYSQRQAESMFAAFRRDMASVRGW